MKLDTTIGKSYSDQILVHGYDLVEDLIGKASLVDIAFIGATKRMPTENESKMLEALMVTVCEHGFTPSSLSTRFTYLGAPDSIQSAIAAGLLGAGSVYLGASEQVAKLLSKYFGKYEESHNIEEIAKFVLDDVQESGKILPGFGHPIHRPVDPRTEKLFELAEELDIAGKNIQLIKEISKEFNRRKGKEITLNAVGAMGAIYADMGIDYRIVRAFAVAARSIGLIAHIREEIDAGRKNSVGQKLFDFAEENTDYLHDEKKRGD